MDDAASPAPPRRSRLRLRPAPVIALGFCLGPVAGLTVLWVLMLVYTILDPGRGNANDAALQFVIFYAYLLIVGGLVCLVFELLFVGPLLMGFHRDRWRWLNGWTGALIGFCLAFTPALLVVLLLPGPPDQTVWNMPTMVACHRTLAGWVWALVGCAAVGVVGLAAAAVFRVISVEVDPGSMEGAP
jgi:hypothetical protein